MQRFHPCSARPLAVLLLLAGLSSCVIRVRDGEWEHSSWSEWEDEGPTDRPPSKATAAGAKSAGGTEMDAELELARLKLERVRLASGAALAAAEGELAAKRAALQQAELELARHLELELPTELAEAELRVDRSTHALAQKRLELEQMESTYEKYGGEDYAEMNRELVVGRERKQLEFAERELELARTKLVLTRDHELPAKTRKLELALDEARRALAAAESELAEQRVSSRIEVLEAEEALRKSERKDGAKPGGDAPAEPDAESDSEPDSGGTSE